MDKQQVMDRTVEVLQPFETSNLISTIQTLTLAQIFTNPVVLIVLAGAVIFGIAKRSTPVLLTVFFLVSMVVFMRYAMPAPGQELTLSSIGPFIALGIAIGAVIIYFSMIKS